MRLWDAVKATAAGVEDDGSFHSPDGPEDCAARRLAALGTRPEDLDLPPGWGDRPYGVVVDHAVPGSSTTLIAFATGEASLLTVDGSGVLGQPNHVHVVVQAKRLVNQAAEQSALFQPATECPHPPTGAMRFHVLTRAGILSAEAQDGRDGPLLPLIEVADELMSEFLQYGLLERMPPEPLTATDWIRALAMVAAIAGFTYLAWLIPIPWLRWPAVAIGVFFTIAALIVPYAMLTARGESSV
jgi:hypothetical protein